MVSTTRTSAFASRCSIGAQAIMICSPGSTFGTTSLPKLSIDPMMAFFGVCKAVCASTGVAISAAPAIATEPQRLIRMGSSQDQWPDSVYLSFVPFPIGLPQFPAKNLAGRVAGQHLGEIDRFGQLVAGDPFPGPGDDLGGRRTYAGLGHHHGLDRLAPFVVRNADHGHVGH